MKKKIGITAWGAVSALGTTKAAVRNAYASPVSYLGQAAESGEWQGTIGELPELKGELAQRKRFLELIDRSVHLTLAAADQLWPAPVWPDDLVGINIGSSRGATTLWEQHYQQFSQSHLEALSPLASPTTTLGNISSWLGAYLGLQGPSISHSVTCSSALQAIINAVAWLESGRCRRFLAGGAEAPLTPFTLAQMKALRIYAPAEVTDFPCRGLDEQQTGNTMVLGEGAALFALETDPEQAFAWIVGIGSAQEVPATPTAISAEGVAMQRAMQQALAEFGQKRVDVVVCHAPGTRRGDAAELHALRTVFAAERMPALTGNKWKLGHALGASGALSLEMAVLMLQQQQFFPIPFLPATTQVPAQINSVMVNALGFGGNAVSVILSRTANL